MGFNTQKTRVIEVEHDFELGDGPEKVYFKPLSPQSVERIVTRRMAVIGKSKNEDGKDIDSWGIPPKDMPAAQLEALAESIVTDETGTKKMFKLDALKSGEVNPSVIAQLADLFNEHCGFFGPEAIKRAKEAEAAAEAGEDPPTRG